MLPIHIHTHLQATQANTQTKACKRVCLTNPTDTAKLDRRATTEKEGLTHNTGFAKVWLYYEPKHLYFLLYFILNLEFGYY
jgi:hypothetical protein